MRGPLCLAGGVPVLDIRPKGWTEDGRVIVYIHGGAYSTGSGNDSLTEGAMLAASGDVVVVTVTHRLNAFGYLSLARLDARYPDSGNAGQLDTPGGTAKRLRNPACAV